MSDLEDMWIEQDLNEYKAERDDEKEIKGICEKCKSEYFYYYYKDNTPGFRCTDEIIQPCKCGKHYGWIKKNHEGYKHYYKPSRYVR